MRAIFVRKNFLKNKSQPYVKAGAFSRMDLALANCEMPRIYFNFCNNRPFIVASNNLNLLHGFMIKFYIVNLGRRESGILSNIRRD